MDIANSALRPFLWHQQYQRHCLSIIRRGLNRSHCSDREEDELTLCLTKRCAMALVRTHVSEELSASIIRVTRIGELGTLAVTSNRRKLRINKIRNVTLMMETLLSSETLVFTKATRRNIPEVGVLHSYRRENLISYVAVTDWAL
jgi:hypothetical protein